MREKEDWIHRPVCSCFAIDRARNVHTFFSVSVCEQHRCDDFREKNFSAATSCSRTLQQVLFARETSHCLLDALLFLFQVIRKVRTEKIIPPRLYSTINIFVPSIDYRVNSHIATCPAYTADKRAQAQLHRISIDATTCCVCEQSFVLP